jgi:pyruvate dehydrogenase (quinone)/pyruvate oxidase
MRNDEEVGTVGQIASEALAERLADRGMDTVFGLPGAQDAILSCDSGTIATWAARHWTIRGGWESYLSGNLATMAPGMPCAIGMQHAFPARQVIAYVGDGGFAMLMAEFLTAIQHQLPIKVVIINNNNSLGQILSEQMALGYPEHGVRYPEPFVNYAAFAEANGGLAIKVEWPAQARDAIQQALGHAGPALVDVNVNPDEPPMPGKVEYQRAKKFAEAFLRSQPRKATIATTLFKDKTDRLKS